MNSLLIKSTKKPLSKSQATFNRLIKKVEKIQRSIKETESLLNEGLLYYHEKVRPTEKKMIEKLIECIPVFYSYYKNSRKNFTKKQQEILKQLIQSLITDLKRYVMPFELSKEITNIIADLEGVDYQKIQVGEMELIKDSLCNYAKEQGLDIDLSTIDPNSSKEELIRNLQKAIFEAVENKSTEEFDPKVDQHFNSQYDSKNGKKKSKKQLQKELKIKELEEIQKKGLSKIYKQLARSLHPDLERDLKVKAEKEELMKKVTVAYENQDLHTLLSLEITWMNRTATNQIELAEEQLSVYNALLNDQIESLQEELDCLIDHPRYFDIQHLLGDDDPSFVFEILDEEKEKISIDLERFSSSIVELGDGTNFRGVKEILKIITSEPDIFEMLESFL